MPSPADAVLNFQVGLAAGLSLLTLTSYRRVSPAWLHRLLMAGALFVFSRYVAMAVCATTSSPEGPRILRHVGWLALLLGFILPSVFAIDQLLRHPAMTPKKLLVRSSFPFLVAWSTATPFQWLRWIYQGMFVLAFVVICALLMRKIPSQPIRLALLGLAVGQSCLAFGGLYGEMAMLLALWYAYETAADAVFA